MTHSGGKPHTNVGDIGQRFEVRYQLDAEAGPGKPTYVMGWAETMDGVERFKRAINLHPSFCNPTVIDRSLKEKK